jgi:hypothetical protein
MDFFAARLEIGIKGLGGHVWAGRRVMTGNINRCGSETEQVDRAIEL